MNGIMDDLQIYDIELTGENVTYLFENPGDTLPGGIIVDPGLDSDCDGMSDVREEVAGTDPFDAASVFAVREVAASAGGIQLTWSSVEGKTYSVEINDGLESENWSVLPGAESIPAAAGSVTTHTDASIAGEQERSYRIVVNPSEG
jgi:hypothetical protein